MLSRAAQTVAEERARTGRAQTVVDVLHGRAVRHYARGLREYLALRLRSSEEATAAWAQLRAMVAIRSSDSLVKAPGVRAHLYRLAREVAASRKVGSRMPSFRHAGHRFDRLRRDLGAEDAELLELRFARELRPAELCVVLDWTPEEVMDRLRVASERACDLLATRRNEGLRGLLLEAFRVDLPSLDDKEESEPALRIGSLIAGRYRIQARVGSGAFGDVYRAEDAEVPGHVVALKLLHQPSYTEEARQHSLRELRHIASVFHPSVVQFKDHGWHERRLWFVMPWYDGETLASRIEREPLTRQEAHRIFVQLARGLEAMHAAGIRHQDIKPDNIFLAELPGQQDVLPVLIDLGVSATEAEMLVAGTPTYFAPEIAAQFASVRNKPWVSAKADVFALALALRNALEPEAEEDVPAGAVEAFIERRACEAPELPYQRKFRFLYSHFRRWMSLDAEERPSAREFVRELDILVEPEQKRDRRRRTVRWLLPLLLLASAGFGGAIVHYETQRAADGEVLSAVRSDLADSSAQREVLREQYESMQLSRRELGQRLAESATTLSALSRSSEQLQERLAALRSSNSGLESRITDARGEIESTRQRLEDAQESLRRAVARGQEQERQAEEQRARLIAQGEERARSLRRAEARTRALEEEAARTESELAASEARIAAASVQAASLQRALDVQIEARRHAEDQVAALRQQGREQSREQSREEAQPSAPLPEAAPESPES